MKWDFEAEAWKHTFNSGEHHTMAFMPLVPLAEGRRNLTLQTLKAKHVLQRGAGRHGDAEE